MSEEQVATLLQEAEWIRKLLLLQALSAGYKQTQLAAVLGVSEATMSRMIPKTLSKKGRAGRDVVGEAS